MLSNTWLYDRSKTIDMQMGQAYIMRASILIPAAPQRRHPRPIGLEVPEAHFIGICRCQRARPDTYKMLLSSHYPPVSALPAIAIYVLTFSLFFTGVRPNVVVPPQASDETVKLASIRDLIVRQKYDEAITQIERVLEKNPGNGEALTYLATANLYHDLDFTKAKDEFEKAFKAGGGATFFVTHSHESFSTGDVVDYCRGWLHLRADSIQFVPAEGTHGFALAYSDVKEFKRNRISKRVFHIKVGEKNQNFRGRSNSEVEPLLIIALYKSFARN